MNPKASFGNLFRSKLRGIIPSAARDCSTYQFQCAVLSELEFHNKAVQQMNISTQQNAASAEELAASMAIFKKRHNIGRNPKKSGATAKSQIKALPQR